MLPNDMTAHKANKLGLQSVSDGDGEEVECQVSYPCQDFQGFEWVFGLCEQTIAKLEMICVLVL